MTPRPDDPRTPNQIKIDYDSVVSNANKVPLQPEPEETSFLPIILFAILTLAGVLGALAFIIQHTISIGG